MIAALSLAAVFGAINCASSTSDTTTTTGSSLSYDTANCDWSTVPATKNFDSTNADLSHRPGQDCMSCHNNTASGTAPAFTAAGTMVSAKNGTNVQIGVESINITTGSGTITIPVDQCGNFYTTATAPYNPLASASISAEVNLGTKMGAKVDGTAPAGETSCNTCHYAGKDGYIYP